MPPAIKGDDYLDFDSDEEDAPDSDREEQDSRVARAQKGRTAVRVVYKSDEADRDSIDAEEDDESKDRDEDHAEPQDTSDLVNAGLHEPTRLADVDTAQTQSTTPPAPPSRTRTNAPQPSTTHLRSLVPTPSLEPLTGVIYLSRIPPYLTPSALRSLLTPFGALHRIFLTPESPSLRAQRLRSGGNKKRSFSDGWAEFARKRDAKTCAAALNAQTYPGAKKGGWYADDVWNVKYLRGFKWRHLTEQIAREGAERAERVRRGIGEERREERRFLGNVERARVVEGRERKKREREGRGKDTGPELELELDGVVAAARGKAPGSKDAGRAMRFAQRAPASRDKAGQAGTGAGEQRPAEDVRRVLGKIF